MSTNLVERVGSSAFAFRGYNTTNLGRSPELLAHPAFGSVLARYLNDASAVCSDAMKRPIDLVARVRERRETTIESYSEAIALIVAVELAHVQLLEEFFDIRMSRAKM